MTDEELDTGITRLRYVGSAYLALSLFTLTASLVATLIPSAYVLANLEAIIQEEVSQQLMEYALYLSVMMMIAVNAIAMAAELTIPYLRATQTLNEVSRTLPRIKGLVKIYVGVLPVGGIIALISWILLAGCRDELVAFMMNEASNILVGGEPVLTNLPYELLVAVFVGSLGMVMTAVARAFLGLSVFRIGSYIDNSRLRLAGTLITVSQIIIVITSGVAGISPLSVLGLVTGIIGYAMLYSGVYYPRGKTPAK